MAIELGALDQAHNVGRACGCAVIRRFIYSVSLVGSLTFLRHLDKRDFIYMV